MCQSNYRDDPVDSAGVSDKRLYDYLGDPRDYVEESDT